MVVWKPKMAISDLEIGQWSLMTNIKIILACINLYINVYEFYSGDNLASKMTAFVVLTLKVCEGR